MSSRARARRYDMYMAKLDELGRTSSRSASIGEEIRSPSVQLRITPLGAARGALHATIRCWARTERAELPRLPLPTPTPTYAAGHHGDAVEGRARAGRARACSAASPSTSSSCGTAAAPDALRHRAEPAEGRHDPPVPDAPVPDRRAATTRSRRRSRAERPGRSRFASERPPRVASCTGVLPPGRSSTSYGAPRAPLQPDDGRPGRSSASHAAWPLSGRRAVSAPRRSARRKTVRPDEIYQRAVDVLDRGGGEPRSGRDPLPPP